MRSVCFILVLTATGCRFSWIADVDTDCAEMRTWYSDSDGDRWGIGEDSQDACGPSGVYTARNDRDCDDADPNNTGKIGSICPDQLVSNTTTPGTPTEFVGVSIGTAEVVVVHDPTERVWARAAEDACGSVGWGGGLFTQSDSAAIVQALDAVPNTQEVWAGFVGVVFNPAAAYPSGSQVGTAPDVAGQWQFLNGDAVPESRLCSFDGGYGADSSDYNPDLGFLALVKDRPPLQGDGSSSDYCFGTPDEALPSDTCGNPARPCYEGRYAHFMCERARPTPENYSL